MPRGGESVSRKQRDVPCCYLCCLVLCSLCPKGALNDASLEQRLLSTVDIGVSLCACPCLPPEPCSPDILA